MILQYLQYQEIYEMGETDPDHAFDAASNMVEMFDDLGYHVTHIDISEEVIVNE